MELLIVQCFVISKPLFLNGLKNRLMVHSIVVDVYTNQGYLSLETMVTIDRLIRNIE